MKEALFYEQIDQNKARCRVCEFRCTIPDGSQGVCHTRTNRKGVLHTLIYGGTSSACIDPIEKKPLYHFHPNTRVFSTGTHGCNFKCPGCQNWQISHNRIPEGVQTLTAMLPRRSVDIACKQGATGICWTYNEPAIWLEHTLEAAQYAKERGLYTAYVTNGYATKEHLDLIGPYLDAYRVDIKAWDTAAYKAITGRPVKPERIRENTAYAKEHWGMHIECVTNVTPTLNDDEMTLRLIAGWIRDALSPYTPWHVTRFHPYLDLEHLPPTPLATLEHACAIAKEEGLHYVYTGNVPGDDRESTHCHHCGKRLIYRQGFAVAEIHLKEGRCAYCNTLIPGCW